MIDYFRAIRRRWPVVLIITLLVVAAALTVSFASQKQYDGSAELLFGGQDRVESLLTPDAEVEPRDPERDINTAVELIENERVAAAVRRQLRLDMTVEDLLDKVEPEASTSSDLVKLRARDPDPERAAAIANAFADQYVAFRQRSARERYDAAAKLADQRLRALPPAQQGTDEARSLRARRDELETTAALQTGGVEIVRQARPADDPSRPRPRLSFVLGLFLGLLIGAAVALVLEFADRRLKDEETVEDVFDLPVLAAIPPPPRRGVDDHLQREAYGMLAANVRLSHTSAESHVVMVTSPSPEEGKTSVTLGMARALARLGMRAIVIEADLRRPSIAKYTSLPPGGGLTRLIIGGGGHLAHELVWLDAASMRPVTLDDLKEGLSFAVLTAGSTPPHPQRLLARPEMGELVETAKSLADVVIIDTPPIGTVTDSVALARFVDTIVVVARLNKTTKDAARRALRVLRNLSADLAGVAVTDAHVTDQSGYYGTEEQLSEEDAAPLERRVESAQR